VLGQTEVHAACCPWALPLWSRVWVCWRATMQPPPSHTYAPSSRSTPLTCCPLPTRLLRYTTIKAVSTAGSEYQYAAGARPSRITEQVVIGTHGRLKQWTGKKMLELDNIQILVFDEADEMLKEDGFADDSVGGGGLGCLGAGLLCGGNGTSAGSMARAGV
jgi:hypothetical protein